jgi:hypothetical protein
VFRFLICKQQRLEKKKWFKKNRKDEKKGIVSPLIASFTSDVGISEKIGNEDDKE